MRLKFFISVKNCSEREMFFHNCRVNFLFECEWIFIFFRNLGAAFRKVFYGCTGREKASLPMFETAFFYAYLESVLALEKLKIGNVGGKKFYILWQKFYRLVCVCCNQKTWAFEKESARKILFVEILFLCAEQKNIYLPRRLIHNFFILRAEGKAESLHIKPVKNF